MKKIGLSFLLFGFLMSGCHQDIESYTINWVNFDGSILESDENVSIGITPVFNGAEPKKPSDDKFNYNWVGWDKEIQPVSGNETYKAIFESEQFAYSVNFNLNGGVSSTCSSTKIISNLSSENFAFDLVKEGANFRGWSYNDTKIFDENGIKINDVELVDNMMFTAMYSNTSKLTILTNVDNCCEISGDGEYSFYSLANICVNAKTGYSFVGWYEIDKLTFKPTELLSQNESYSFLIGKNDITIMAVFNYKSFKLNISSYNPDLGLVFDTASSSTLPYENSCFLHDYLSLVTISAVEINHDYKFLGWFNEDNNILSTSLVYTFNMVDCDFNLFAKWDKFNINYMLNGGVNNPNNPTQYSSDETVYLADPLPRNGYIFKGWFCNNEPIEIINGANKKHVDLYAQWELVEYSIDYNLNNGLNSSLNPSSYNCEEDFDLANPTKDHYEFLGWTDKAGNTIERINSGQTGNLSLSANWKPVEYIIEYNLDGGTNNENNPESYNIESEDILLENPSKTGYVFNYWKDEQGNKVEIIKSGSHGNIKLTADWSIIEHQITYVLEGGANNQSNPKELNVISAGFELLAPTKENNVFDGWYLDPEFREEIKKLPSFETESLTLYAKWCDFTGFIYSIDKNIISVSGYVGLLTEIQIPELSHFSIKIKGGNWSGLKSVVFSNSVVSIDDYAFSGHQLLTAVYIPDSVVMIGRQAFGSCKNLTLHCHSIGQPVGWANDWNYYDSPLIWESFGFIRNDDIVYSIISNESLILTSLEDKTKIDITIPSIIDGKKVVSIYPEAFAKCRLLRSLIMPDTITSIGEEAFYECWDLRSVTISNTLKTIERGLFARCYNLKSVIIPDSVISIGYGAFNECQGLISVTIPDSVTSIGESAFGECTNLHLVFIPKSVESIGRWAFPSDNFIIYCEAPSKPTDWNEAWYSGAVLWNCTEFFVNDGIKYYESPDKKLHVVLLVDKTKTNVVIPESIDGKSVVSINTGAFCFCNSLTSVVIPNSVTSIGDSAFECTPLTSILIPNSVTSIGSYAFHWCDEIKEIIIPNSVTSIGYRAFWCGIEKIYCEAPSKPSGWDDEWSKSYGQNPIPVEWGYIK